MVKRLGLMAAAVVVVFAMAGCEPAMTITAKDAEHLETCGLPVDITGVVSPASATPKVVLQQTAGGKWVDVKGWANSDTWGSGVPVSVRTGNVSKSSGAYTIHYLADWLGTKHLRVRSDGASATSHGFYVTNDAYDGSVC